LTTGLWVTTLQQRFRGLRLSDPDRPEVDLGL